jgi:hypothetical protein
MWSANQNLTAAASDAVQYALPAFTAAVWYDNNKDSI